MGIGMILTSQQGVDEGAACTVQGAVGHARMQAAAILPPSPSLPASAARGIPAA